MKARAYEVNNTTERNISVRYIIMIALACIVNSASAFMPTYHYSMPDSIPADSCTNEGYTNCETCVAPTGVGVSWGPIQMISYPMANVPNDLIACGPQPGCTLLDIIAITGKERENE